MRVQVVASKPRDDGHIEVTAYADGVRFTAVLAPRVFGTPIGDSILQAMAERQVTEMARLREIVRPGKPEREA